MGKRSAQGARTAKRRNKKPHSNGSNGTNGNKRPRNGGARREFEAPLILSSAVRGQRAFQWLLAPLGINDFNSKHFERAPIHLSGDTSRFSSFLNVADMRKLVTDGVLHHGRDLDVTSYKVSSGRATHTGTYDSATDASTWSSFEKNGCSLRMLRPQAHCDALWSLCALLEECLQCAVGANIYLTPPGTQGFAPHFDDIDAFVCQIQGAKHWRVYEPAKDGTDTLPRASSIDFEAKEMSARKCVIDVVLKPGDVLYMPRGAVHEARAVDNELSLHVTLSAHQRWTWADLLLETVHDAVRSAAAQEPALRQTLPPQFAQYVGLSRADANPQKRATFDKCVRAALKKVAKLYPIDAAADKMAARFIADRLPPPTSLVPSTEPEQEIKSNSSVRAVAQAVARVVMADDGLPRIIHAMDNERQALPDRKSTEMTCTPDEALAVDFILGEYPDSVRVKDIPLDDPEDRIDLVEGLVQMRIVQVVE